MSQVIPAGAGEHPAEPDSPDPGPGDGVKRPLEVWVIVVLGLLQAVGALAVAAVLFYARTHPDLVDLLAENEPDISDSGLLATAVGVGLVGAVNLVLAILLAVGNKLARAIYAVTATFQIAAATYGLVAVRDIRVAAIVALLYPIAVIWLLYGSERSVRFFDS
ncbi:MAG: hypothetical protein ACR2OH_11375 [Microthrixaceae bacterium]